MPRRRGVKRETRREAEFTIYVRDETRPLCALLALAFPGLAILVAWPLLAEQRLYTWPEWSLAWWVSFAVGCLYVLHAYPVLALARDSLAGRAVSMRIWPWPGASLLAAIAGAYAGEKLACAWLVPAFLPEVAALLSEPAYEARYIWLYQVGCVAVRRGLVHGLAVSFAISACVLAAGTIYMTLRGRKLITVDLYGRGRREPVERVSLLLTSEEAGRVKELLPLKLQGLWPKRGARHLLPIALHVLATGLSAALLAASLHIAFLKLAHAAPL
ncbi:hypothetical protein DRO60_00540 [Candidatus Bathyarchaeota archaeon]|nr:MAG: hypothetical protein DRO60_00540 [Candidatus Bathyarchaeota archaeon]